MKRTATELIGLFFSPYRYTEKGSKELKLLIEKYDSVLDKEKGNNEQIYIANIAVIELCLYLTGESK